MQFFLFGFCWPSLGPTGLCSNTLQARHSRPTHKRGFCLTYAASTVSTISVLAVCLASPGTGLWHWSSRYSHEEPKNTALLLTLGRLVQDESGRKRQRNINLFSGKPRHIGERIQARGNKKKKQKQNRKSKGNQWQERHKEKASSKSSDSWEQAINKQTSSVLWKERQVASWFSKL